jgi:hypothetical protein
MNSIVWPVSNAIRAYHRSTSFVRGAVRAAATLSASIALAGCACGAVAQTIYSANGWESTGTPAWATGTIIGKNSWSATGGTTPSSSPNLSTSAIQQAAFQVVKSATITGPGGTETVTPYAGSQMLASATTYSVANSGTYSFYNLAHDSFYTAWTKRTAGNNVLQTQVNFFDPQVDSSLLGYNGFNMWGGVFGLTDLGEVGLANDTSGNVDLLWVPASSTYGNSITVTSAQYPVLQRDTWESMTVFMDYNSGSVSVSVNNQMILNTGPGAFDTTNNYYCSEIGNISNTADGTSDYVFFDNYNIVASTPGPGALPVFSGGFAMVLYGTRSMRRRGISRPGSR